MKYKAILLLLVCSSLLLPAQQKPSQEWLDRKFSMFIHFGLYSVYGGVYEGQPVKRGYSEQIQSFAGIFSGNAVYILLNGRYLTAHFSPERVNHQRETVLIPLQKGLNQLVVKYYNGFEKELCYSITPLWEWRRYAQKLPTMQLSRQELHRLRLSDNNPLSKVSPLRMHHIEIKL